MAFVDNAQLIVPLDGQVPVAPPAVLQETPSQYLVSVLEQLLLVHVKHYVKVELQHKLFPIPHL